MSRSVQLHGYGFSVYTRIARMVLHLKSVDYDFVEVDPFGETSPELIRLNPFHKVPVLSVDGFHLYETAAITRFVDRAFPEPPLQPASPQSLGRVDQVVSIIDNYAYAPLVRMVFAHVVFRPLVGMAADARTVSDGLERSEPVLGALEAIADQGVILAGTALTLADCHLAPMIDYFQRSDQGAQMLRRYPALSRWCADVSGHPSLVATEPDFAAFS